MRNVRVESWKRHRRHDGRTLRIADAVVTVVVWGAIAGMLGWSLWVIGGWLF